MFNYVDCDAVLVFRRPYRIDQIEREARSVPGIKAAEGWRFDNARRMRPDDTESDPLFIRGPGLEFLAEESLAQGVPLVGSGAWEVRHGAVFCSQAAQRAVAEAAAKNIAAFLESSPGAGRVESAPAGGRILFHRGLAARYGLTPRAPQWLELR